MNDNAPTPHAEVNSLVLELLRNIRSLLGCQFSGMYLEGSLANGDFDSDSDIDFVAVTDEAITNEQFTALQQMHDRIATLDTPWAVQMEGSYLSRAAIRRHDPLNCVHPNLERGLGERLKWVEHDEGWNIHRFILRERGITLAGPSPETLIDQVTPDDLRRSARETLTGWGAGFLENPRLLQQRGYQSYVVLSICRILYTLEFGDVVSKQVAARWALAQAGQPFKALIKSALIGRHNSDEPAIPAEIAETLDMIRFAMQKIA